MIPKPVTEPTKTETPAALERLRAGLGDGLVRRRRLELAAAVVASALGVTGLASAVQPMPKFLEHAPSAELSSAVQAERRNLERIRTEGFRPTLDPAFVVAVRTGDLGSMKRLYEPGMPLYGMLSLAAEKGDEHVVRWLLDHEANVQENARSEQSPVLLADEHPAVVKLLLARGVPDPPLEVAAGACAINAVTRRLAAKDDPNPRSASPLAEALASPRPYPKKKAVVAALLAAGADMRVVTTNTSSNTDPLAAALSACAIVAPEPPPPAEECTALVEDFLARGARATGDAIAAAMQLEEPFRARLFGAVMAAPTEPGAPSVALARSMPTPPELVKVLVKRGVDWAWHDGEPDEALPLVSAVQKGDRDAVRAMLDAGAPADRRYKSGVTAMSAALEGLARGPDGARVLELLVEHGADPNRRLPDGRTPLFAAAESGELRAVGFLLQRGANPNTLVLEDTALDAAEQGSQVGAARLIHASGGRRGHNKMPL